MTKILFFEVEIYSVMIMMLGVDEQNGATAKLRVKQVRNNTKIAACLPSLFSMLHLLVMVQLLVALIARILFNVIRPNVTETGSQRDHSPLCFST